MRSASRTRSVFGYLALAAVLLPIGSIAIACATSDPVDSGKPGGKKPQGGDEDEICLLHNCNSDAECGTCTNGRNTCLVEEHRCVACNSATGAGCPQGQYCSPWGNCAPDGVTCETDEHGAPKVACQTSIDCSACDPMHLVCDNTTSKCVACTPNDTSECQATDVCIAGACSAKCPAGCMVDNDCSQCGGTGFVANACNAHKCAECSPTYACPAGEVCTPAGVCVRTCGTDGKGVCTADADCEGCGGGANACHAPINGGSGKCGPSAAGCSDLGNGVVVLPEPWSNVTNLCSSDSDCDGIGVDLNVGKILRDLTGVDQINDANVFYGMNVCADITVGLGNQSLSCGVCVPCRVDSDCNDIDIDQVAGDAFGPIGSIAAAFLLDQVFGQNDHVVHMYCETVAGDYGVCAPCPGFVYDCGIGGGNGGGGGGSCDHEVCDTGGPLGFDCDSCTQAVCGVDDYCCTNQWDAQCINEANAYCDAGCSGGGGGGACTHDECAAGVKLDPNCSPCATAVCQADSFCCTDQWDNQCVSEADQTCSPGCGGGGGTGGQPCDSPIDCPWPQGCTWSGECGACQSDDDCDPDFCDAFTGECY